MTAGTHSQGAFSQIFFSAAGDTAPHTYESGDPAYRVEYLREDLTTHARIIGTDNGITGTRSHRSERARYGAAFHRGTIDMFVSAVDFTTLLPLLIGDNESPAGTFNLEETLPYFGILVDTDYSTFEFKDCKVNRWALRSRAPALSERGEPDLLLLTMEIFGSADAKGTALPSSPPSLTSQGYYVFSDCDGAVTIEGSARPIQNFVLACDNHLFPLYANSLDPHSICEQDRDITFRCKVPWNSTQDGLYNVALAGATASLVFTNGGLSTTFTIGTLQIPRKQPIIRGKTEIPLILDGVCRQVSSTKELVVVNDATP